MEYEYRVIKLCGNGVTPPSDAFDSLQKWFDAGWEYVDQINQRGVTYPLFGVILRKIKIKELI